VFQGKSTLSLSF